MNKKFNVGKLFLFGVVFSVLFSLMGCLQPNDGETKLDYSDGSGASDASLAVLKLGSENLSLTASQIYKTVDNSVEKQMLEVVASSSDANVIVKFKSAYAPIDPPDYEPRVDTNDLISEDLEELDLYSNKCELHLGEGINIAYIKVISGNGKKTKNITIVITRKSVDIPDGVDASVALKELKITCNGKTEDLMKKINNNTIYAEGFVSSSYYRAQLNVVPNDKDADVSVTLNEKPVRFYAHSHLCYLYDLKDNNIITVKVSKNTEEHIYTIHFNKLTETPAIVPVKSVSLGKSEITLKVGETAKLKASILPTNATNQNVTWKSDRNYIASVSNDGVVTAKYAGYYSEARITVTTEDGNKTATCVVKVVKNNSTPGVPVKSVSLDKSEITLKVGETAKLKATVLPSNATNKKLTWGSNSYVASVSNEGEIQAKYEGTATITVTTEDGKKTDRCIVHIVKNTPTPVVVPVKSVSLNESEITLKVGETTKLKATVSPYNATNKKVLWSSNKSYVVSVSNTGEIEAKSNGTAIITVTTEDGHKTANCIVNVGDSDVPVKSVSLNESKVTLKVGETVKLIETVLPSNATNKHVSWSSSSYIASVENGLVTAKYSGTTVITVTTEDGSKTASCTVIVEKPSNNARLSVLKLGSKTLSTYSSSIHETVPNSSSTVNLTVTTQDDKATKQIKLQKANEYASQTITGSGDAYSLELNEGVNVVEIKITAEDGYTTNRVVLNITREKGSSVDPTPTPDDPTPPQGNVQVKVNVISFIGGANVSGTTVKVYRHGSKSSINSSTTNSNGDAIFNLEAGKVYDFLAVGKSGDRAESKVEGVKITYRDQVVSIVQRPGNPQELAKAPEFLSVEYREMKNNILQSPGYELKDGSDFSKETYGVREGVYVVIKSYGRAIITPWTQDGFGVGLGIGSRPTQYTRLGDVIYIDNAGIKNSDGSWTCKYFIDLKDFPVPNGEETMYIVAYDYAGNRIERQIRINFKYENNSNKIAGSRIEKLAIDVSRRPKPTYTFSAPNVGNDQIGTFGMDTIDDFETSIQVLVAFQIDTRINGFKVYRKEESSSDWIMVAHKAYGFPSGGGNQSFLPIRNAHFILDSEGGLYEGKTYKYYVEAYGGSQKDIVKSKEVSVTIMPSFYIELDTPAINKVIDKKNAEFKFKVSNPALLDGKMSDSFEFGLLVMDKQGSHSQLTAFASKMRYVFNQVGDARLEIASSSSHYQTLGEWKRRVNALRGLSVEDLISYDKYSGIVTIKNAFLEIAEFNIGGTRRAFSESVESGHAYHWDVQDWGIKTGDWRDDAAAKFEKIDEVNGIYSRSYSNLRGSDNAINGRLEFSVK